MSSTRTKKVLCVTDDHFQQSGLPIELPDWCELVRVNVNELETQEIGRLILDEQYDGFLILKQQDGNDRQWQFWHLMQNSEILNQMPDGFAVVDKNNKTIWANKRLTDWFNKESLVGLSFFDALDSPEIIGESSNPLATALKTGQPYTATLKLDGHRYYQMRAAPIRFNNEKPTQNVVTISDVSNETLHLQKLEAIHNAGSELADLTPEEVFRMNLEERIDLLKANIIHYTQDLLNYDVVEIRLIDRKTNRCEPLLSEGIDSEISKRPMYAEAQGNGVTGFVCATGKSYLCEDTTSDPLYLDGLIGAKSSLTVPLVLHDEVIGSFNVESQETNAFRQGDLQLLKIFSRDIARALNTLELLVAQKTNSAQESVEEIDIAVAKHIDEILNDTVHVIETYSGDDGGVARRLRSILRNSRNIKRVIHNARKRISANEAMPESIQIHQRPKMQNSRILVVDANEEIRENAHLLLERYGCIVETAHEGKEAILMVRNCDPDSSYDAILADIRLPDLSGYELLMQLKDFIDDPPLVLMTGFGYDPGHSVVKARKAGLRANSVLYKPFKLDQLLETVERILNSNQSD